MKEPTVDELRDMLRQCDCEGLQDGKVFVADDGTDDPLRCLETGQDADNWCVCCLADELTHALESRLSQAVQRVEALEKLVKEAMEDSATTGEGPGCFYCDRDDGQHSVKCPAGIVMDADLTQDQP